MGSVIGITPNYSYTEHCYKIHEDYFHAIQQAGGQPVLLAPNKEIPPYIQGLVFSGGGDVDPLLFGEEPLENNGEISPLRDSFELPLCKNALKASIPLLGICRGMQILALAAGSSIFQDIKSQTSSPLKHSQQAPRFHPTHYVDVAEGSRLYQLTGQKQLLVNSFHHQAVASPGADVLVSAKSADGLIEAIEHKSHPFAIGLQWHPEAMKDTAQKAIFQGFLNAASKLQPQ